MKISSIILSTLALVTVGLTLYYSQSESKDLTFVPQFMEFKQKYNKFSSSPSELEYRYSIFLDNLKFIEQENKKGKTFEMGVNQFSDLTWEEFKNYYLSIEIPNETYEGVEIQDVVEVDWREKGAVTPVKDQGQCGSCWAFSTTGSLEGATFLKTGKLPSLSEQELVDCSTSFGNYGCGGGLMTFGLDYVKQYKLGTESDYPYEGRDNSCRRKETGDRYTTASYRVLQPATVEQLLAETQNSPVSVAIEVQRDFMNYKSGVYENKNCGRALNHGVLVVGQKDDYHIVKNSWSDKWGDKGYIKMKITTGSGTCGIANGWDVVPVL